MIIGLVVWWGYRGEGLGDQEHELRRGDAVGQG